MCASTEGKDGERRREKEEENGLSLVEIKERRNKYNWTTLESSTRRNLLRVPQTSMAAIQKYFWTKSRRASRGGGRRRRNGVVEEEEEERGEERKRQTSKRDDCSVHPYVHT